MVSTYYRLIKTRHKIFPIDTKDVLFLDLFVQYCIEKSTFVKCFQSTKIFNAICLKI